MCFLLAMIHDRRNEHDYEHEHEKRGAYGSRSESSISWLPDSIFLTPTHDVNGEDAVLMSGQQIIDEVADD